MFLNGQNDSASGWTTTSSCSKTGTSKPFYWNWANWCDEKLNRMINIPRQLLWAESLLLASPAPRLVRALSQDLHPWGDLGKTHHQVHPTSCSRSCRRRPFAPRRTSRRRQRAALFYNTCASTRGGRGSISAAGTFYTRTWASPGRDPHSCKRLSRHTTRLRLAGGARGPRPPRSRCPRGWLVA